MQELRQKLKRWRLRLLHLVEKAKRIIMFAMGLKSILSDFSVFLHQLRTYELSGMPPGAKVFLSAGCSGSWYFDWIKENYGALDKHVGVEYYASKPSELPPEVEWISNTVSQMTDVPDATVDLVFSGQNIEHLWPEEVVGFLIEASRVLKTGGWLVADSPNRKVTKALSWSHPEHVIEFEVSEILELLALAGFQDVRAEGIWVCYDPMAGEPLPLSPVDVNPKWSLLRRVQSAHRCPDDSFLWWVEAKKSDIRPDRQAIRRRVGEIFEIAWPERIQRLQTIIGAKTIRNDNLVVSSRPGESGVLIYGPYMPLKAGEYRVSFHLFADVVGLEPETVVCICEVLSSHSTTAISSKSLSVKELSTGFSDVELDFELKRLHFGVQFRVIATGATAVSAVFRVKLAERDSVEVS
jgi:hypothetical protein